MTEVIVMTAYGTIESAVEAMRLGAFDYIQKPFTEQELLVKVGEGARAAAASHGEVQLLAAASSRSATRSRTSSAARSAIREVLGAHRAHRADRRDRAHHRRERHRQGARRAAIHANSKRADRPFVPVNCAAITETLLESELFGHARGAFTGAVSARKGLFEEADGGTLFFDEIAETPLVVPGQAPARDPGGRDPARRREQADPRRRAHHRRDQPGPADRRSRRSASGRTSTTGSTSRASMLPPLRERREDIPLLVEYFLDKYNTKMSARARARRGRDRGAHGTTTSPATSASSRTWSSRPWRSRSGGVITRRRHPARRRRAERSAQRRPHARRRRRRGRARRRSRRRCASSTAAARRAAEVLGISPTTLWRKMTRLGITFEVANLTSVGRTCAYLCPCPCPNRPRSHAPSRRRQTPRTAHQPRTNISRRVGLLPLDLVAHSEREDALQGFGVLDALGLGAEREVFLALRGRVGLASST